MTDRRRTLRRTAGLGLVAACALAAAGPAAAAAPQLSVTLDAGSDAWTSAPARTIHRTVTPANVDGLVLRTYVDGSLVDSSPAADLPMTFADGDHTVGVQAEAPGHTTSPRALARVRVDTAAPVVTLDVPPFVAHDDLPFVGRAFATDAGSGVQTRLLTVDGAPATFGSWFSLPLAPGPHTFTGTVTDVAGNTGSASAGTTVGAPPPPFARPTPTPSSRKPARPAPRRRATSSAPGYALCANLRRGEQCGPGNGRTTRGGKGTGKVSHRGWPRVTGVLWKVLDSGDHQRTGGPDNDELLGHHGDDKVVGLGGHDILWGDWDPVDNNGRQKDVLVGNGGNDWIYPSHGTNRIRAGSGADRIIAFYGHGTIDCGPGRDMAQVRMNGAYRLRGCEKVKHFN